MTMIERHERLREQIRRRIRGYIKEEGRKIGRRIGGNFFLLCTIFFNCSRKNRVKNVVFICLSFDQLKKSIKILV